MRMGSDTVTVLRYAAEFDAFGDPPANEVPLETDITGCSVQPRASTERTDHRDTVETVYTAFLPAGSDVLPTDRIRWRDVLYQVDARPGDWFDLTGSLHHLELPLRRVEG